MHLILLLFIGLNFSANNVPNTVSVANSSRFDSPEIVLNLKPPLVTGTTIKLGYDIPYPGYIEFHLFDADGTKLWADYGVREKGEHYQSLKKDKLKPGVNYNFEFWYKGKPYPGKFSI